MTLTVILCRFLRAVFRPGCAVLRHFARGCRAAALLFPMVAAISQADAQIAGAVEPLNAKILGNYVRTAVLQPDGKIIIAGEFTSVQGVPRSNIARLHPDGSLDTAFDVGTDSWIYSVVVQPDGRILLGGHFLTVKPAGSSASVGRNYIARLMPDGRLDTAFNPRANDDVTSIALQPDGSIVCGGYFTAFWPDLEPAPVFRERLARLFPDGLVDLSLEVDVDFLYGFPPAIPAYVFCVAVQPDGGILVGGRVPGAGSTFGAGFVFRVAPDNTIDPNFEPLLNGYVNAIALQPDGRIILGGAFNAYRADLMTPPVVRCYILRLFPTGLLDQAFNPNPDGIVECLALQTDNRVLMGGAFNELQPPNLSNPVERQHLARVNADGSVDFTFSPRTDNDVSSIALQMDGKILVGGYFTKFLPGAGRNFFGRLSNSEHTQVLSTPVPTQVLWERAGALGEVSDVVFEQSTDGGVTWSFLGTPTRVVDTPGNWELTTVDPIAVDTRLRARARNNSGNRGYDLLQFPVPAVLGAREEWNQTWFGSPSSTGIAASDADPNGNGIPNLLEYALGGDPVGDTTGTTILPRVSLNSMSSLLEMTMKRYPSRNDITITAQATDDVVNGPWEDFASSVNGAPFSLIVPEYGVSESAGGEPRDVIFTDKPGTTTARRFMRIKVTES